jgi:hypothetical protein
METKQERFNKELSQGNSIAWWAIGYYTEVGNEYCPSMNIAIFDRREHKDLNITQVLIDFLGSMMWINVRTERVFYGWGWGKLSSPSAMGKELRRKLELIKM